MKKANKTILVWVLMAVLVLFGCSYQESAENKILLKDYDESIIVSFDKDKQFDLDQVDIPIRQGYTFIGWDQSKLDDEFVIHAMYEKENYIVNFYNDDHTLIDSEIIAYDEDANGPELLFKEGYTFIGWDQAITNIQSNMNVFALYTPNWLKESITWEARGADFKGGENAYFFNEYLNAPINTFEALIKMDFNSIGGVILGNFRPSYARYTNYEMNDKGQLFIMWNSTSKILFDQYDFRTGNYEFISVVRNEASTDFSLYVNGVFIQKVDRVTEIQPNTIKYVIGSDNAVNPTFKRPFDGEIKQITAYSKSLDSSEVLEDYETYPDIDGSNRSHLVFNYKLKMGDKALFDTSGNGYIAYFGNVEHFYDGELYDSEDYTIALVPDPQMLTSYYVEGLNTIASWILDNHAQRNIQMVMSLGDNANKQSSYSQAQFENELSRVSNMFSRLDNQVKYMVVPGNHDYENIAKQDHNLDTFNEFFPYEKFSEFDYFGGAKEVGKIENTYYKFETHGVKYLVFGVDYIPTDDTIEWAKSVTEAHMDYRVIVITHWYLDGAGNRAETSSELSALAGTVNHGQAMWDKWLSRYENIFMVFGGHVHSDDILMRTDQGIHGNTVMQFLINVQALLNNDGLEAFLGLLTFNETKQTVSMNYFSTITNKLFNVQNQYTFSFEGYTNIHGDNFDSNAENRTNVELRIDSLYQQIDGVSTPVIADEPIVNGYAVSLIENEHADAWFDKLVALPGDLVKIYPYVAYGYALSGIYINDILIEDNSFIMPVGDVLVELSVNPVFGDDDLTLALTTSGMKANSHWYTTYGTEGMHIKIKVEDSLVAADPSIFLSIGYMDNIEFIMAYMTENSGHPLVNAARVLITANGDYYLDVPNGYGGWNRMTNATSETFNYEVALKHLSNNDGYSGYEIDVFLNYALLGLTEGNALNNITIAPSIRNSTNLIKTLWKPFDAYGADWENANTYFIVNADGTYSHRNIPTTASFYDYMGELIDVVETARDERPVFEFIPSRPADDLFDYEFVGWSDSSYLYEDQLPIIIDETTFHPVFKAVEKTFEVVIKYLKAGTNLSIALPSVYKVDALASYQFDMPMIGDLMPNLPFIKGIADGDKNYDVYYGSYDVWDGSIATGFETGVGTLEDPYLISTGSQLAYLSYLSNQITSYGAGLHFRLTNHIDLNDIEFIPISFYGANTTTYRYFRGTFDGNGYTIYNFRYHTDSALGVGLFGVAWTATIKNLTVHGSVSALSRVGGIVYWSRQSDLINLTSYVDVSTPGIYSGGVAGSIEFGADNTIKNLTNYGTVIGIGARVGGVVGTVATAGTLDTFTNYGTVKGVNRTGGVVGSMTDGAILTAARNFGSVEGEISTAGIAGFITSSQIFDAMNFGDVMATENNVGGIAGNAYGTGLFISNVVNYGRVTGDLNAVGGIVGYLTQTLEDAKNYGDVSGNIRVGGIVGHHNTTSANTSLVKNTGHITGAGYVGGVIGHNQAGTLTDAINFGDVSANIYASSYFGGVVGQNSNIATIQNAIHMGNVYGSISVGGVAGYNGNGSTVANYKSFGIIRGEANVDRYIGNSN